MILELLFKYSFFIIFIAIKFDGSCTDRPRYTFAVFPDPKFLIISNSPLKIGHLEGFSSELDY